MTLSQIAKKFDARAEEYDNLYSAFIAERELQQIRKLIPAPTRVLDYGCGTGRTTLDLLKRGCQVTAYDISTQMMAQAQAKTQKLELKAEFISDPSQLGKRTWPVVTCIGVLDYYPDPTPILSSLRQYIEPSGRLIVTYPNIISPFGWLYKLGSQFTVPAYPRSPKSASWVANEAGFSVASFCYAFPSIAVLGHTLVLSLSLKFPHQPTL